MMTTRILVVCTANQCRSPMAAALLEARLREARIDAAVASAGLYEGGRPAWPEAVAVLRKRGLDLSTHLSARLDADVARAADLVLGMTREHVREVVALAPDAYPRTFTYKELVRRGEAMPRLGAPLLDWLADLSAQREPRDLLGAAAADDVEDPIGGTRRRFRATADELDDLAARLLAVAWP